MKPFFAILLIQLTLSTRPVINTIVLLVFALGFFALVIGGVIGKIRDFEAREGIWYCEELEMQISFSDPKDAFLMERGEKIRCLCDAGIAKHCYGIIELYCQEWEHPNYTHGKTLFSAEIRAWKEMSMVVYDRKNRRQYTFVRTDKVE